VPVINRGRFVLAGLAAGVVMNAVTFFASPLYAAEMFAILHDHRFAPPRGPVPIAVFLLMRFTWGFVAVWLYTTAQARYGHGVKTAALVGFVFWLGSIFLAVVSYGMLGLFPTTMLAQWAIITLIALMLSTLIGAWIYRED
jgi:hypothetical protein